jgi:HSP20 family protein
MDTGADSGQYRKVRRRDPVIDLFFEDLPHSEECPWRPPADIVRTKGGVIVKLDLAGVDPRELQVSVHGGHLHIAGARRDVHASEALDHYRMEIAYSHFERTFELPPGVRAESLSVDYRDGMLFVFLEGEQGER